MDRTGNIKVPCVPGAPSWVTLLSPDVQAAQEFYGPLLGWRFQTVPQPGEGYVHALVGTTRVAGLGTSPDRGKTPGAWTVFFGTDDIDGAARRVEERAGTIGVGPRSFNSGRLALAADPRGARFGLWQGPQGPARHMRLFGAPNWAELATLDAFEAALFYGAVLDWDSHLPQHQVVHYEHERVVVHVQGSNVAALHSVPDRPAQWNVSFAVRDIETAANQAQRLGAHVLEPPKDTPHGATTTLTDTQGTPFTLVTPVIHHR